MVDRPACKERFRDIPFFAVAIGSQNKCTFGRTDENSHTAHQSCPLCSMSFKSYWSSGIEFRNRKHRKVNEQSPFANIAAPVISESIPPTVVEWSESRSTLKPFFPGDKSLFRGSSLETQCSGGSCLERLPLAARAYGHRHPEAGALERELSVSFSDCQACSGSSKWILR